MKKLLFFLFLFSTISFSQTKREVTSLNGFPATGTITYNDSSATNSLSPWTLKIDIKTLDNSIEVKTEYIFGTEELVNDKTLSLFFYQYNDDGNIVKKLTINSTDDTNLDFATFIDYDEKKVCYSIKF